ncbi:MAG: hypothetical protein K6T34_02750 [Thermoflavifilum sp.]|nr:hypothetical protein [Thermoflavifilum sp.]
MKHKWYIFGVGMLVALGVGLQASAQRWHKEKYEKHEVVLYDRGEEHLPPGLVKKAYGERSARCFAPGHRKWRKSHVVYVIPVAPPPPVVYVPQSGVHVWISAQAGF